MVDGKKDWPRKIGSRRDQGQIEDAVKDFQKSSGGDRGRERSTRDRDSRDRRDSSRDGGRRSTRDRESSRDRGGRSSTRNRSTRDEEPSKDLEITFQFGVSNPNSTRVMSCKENETALEVCEKIHTKYL